MTQADVIREGSYDFKRSSREKIRNNFTLSELSEMTKDRLIELVGKVHPKEEVGAGVYRGLLQVDKSILIATILGMRQVR